MNDLIMQVVANLTKITNLIEQNLKINKNIQEMVSQMYNSPPYGPGYVASEENIQTCAIVDAYDDIEDYPESPFAHSFV